MICILGLSALTKACAIESLERVLAFLDTMALLAKELCVQLIAMIAEHVGLNKYWPKMLVVHIPLPGTP
jgi:hypothetical protein